MPRGMQSKNFKYLFLHLFCMQEVPLEEILQAAKIVTQERKNGDSVAAIVQLLLKSGYDSKTIEKILAESDKLM